MAIKIKVSIDRAEILLCKQRLDEAFKAAGYPKSMSAFLGVPVSTIKSMQSRGRISPRFADMFQNKYKGIIDKKFTRQYLRPDLKPWDWLKLDQDK